SDEKRAASHPPRALDEIADIIEMVRQIGMPGADRLRIRMTQSEEALHHLLAQQVLGDFEVHLDIEPGGQASYFGTVDGVDADQHFFAIDLVKVLDNGGGVRKHGSVWL